MSIDLLTTVTLTEQLVPVGIFLFGGYRALEIARLFVAGVYKGRAYWTAALIVATLVFFLAIGTSVPYLSYGGGTPGFPVMFLALIFCADSNIRVMKESDFFHRDILRWSFLRKPVIVVLMVETALLVYSFFIFPEVYYSSPNPPFWAGVFEITWFGSFAFAVCYAAAALIVGARRTADKSLRRYARMLGLSFVSFSLFFTIWIPLGIISQDLGNVVSSFFMIPAAYYIYRAVTSLSPLGKVDRSETASTPGDATK